MRPLASNKNGGRRIMSTGIVQRRLASVSEALLGHEFYFARDPRNVINWYELRVYSQNGEDGILLYIFSKIGVTNRTFVEFGVGEGKQCNTANLCLNLGWRGLMMDSSRPHVYSALRYYRHLGKGAADVKILHCNVTAENINSTLLQNGLGGDIDLLSIDIDGNDYWVWKAIDAIAPRVVVIEYNPLLGHTQSLTVKYDPNFDRFGIHSSGIHHGASLAAMERLGSTKGYTLVGCDSSGVNAFFVRRDLARGKISAVSPEDAYYPSARWSSKLSLEKQFDLADSLDFIKV